MFRVYYYRVCATHPAGGKRKAAGSSSLRARARVHACGDGGPDFAVVVIVGSCFIKQEAAASETGCFWFPSINTKRSRWEGGKQAAQREARFKSRPPRETGKIKWNKKKKETSYIYRDRCSVSRKNGAAAASDVILKGFQREWGHLTGNSLSTAGLLLAPWHQVIAGWFPSVWHDQRSADTRIQIFKKRCAFARSSLPFSGTRGFIATAADSLQFLWLFWLDLYL